MVALLVGISIAALLTSLFAFRFDMGRRPWVLAGYFGVFLCVEWVAARFFLPPNALGIDVAAMCFGLAILFAGATEFRQRKEDEASAAEAAAEAERGRDAGR